MSRYLLDTSIIIDYLRGKKETVSFVDDLEGELTSSFICLAELYEGVYQLTRNQEQTEQAITIFFQGLSEVFGLDKHVAQKFGISRVSLKKSGEIIEDMDLLIAATALSNNCFLITKNPKHFSRVKGLEVISV